ncbi:MAG: hypothetical protein PVH88_26595 [Ignavibacteria bacterium]
MVRIFFILVILIFLSCSQREIDEKSIYEIAEMKITNIDKDDIVDKINELTKNIDSNRKLPESLVKRGLYFTKLRKYDKAKNDLFSALKIDSTFVGPYFGLGLVLLDKGMYEQYMLKSSNKLMDNDSTEYKKLYERARLYFTKAIRRDSTLDNVFAYRALSNDLLNNYNSALLDYKEAIKINERIDYYVDRALLFFKLDSIEKANNDFRSAIALTEKKSDLYFLKAFTNSEHGNINEAIKDYTWLIENDSLEDYSHYLERANLYKRIDSNFLALKDLKTISKIDPSINFQNFDIAGIYAEMGYNDSALVYIRKAHIFGGNEKEEFIKDERFRNIIKYQEFIAIFD